MNEINICFICDEKYVMPTVVAIKSLFVNRNSERTYYIHILGIALSENSKNTLCCLREEDFKIEIMDIEINSQISSLKKENLHVSTAAIYKFIIPEIFKDYERILYIDSDVIVNKDISSWYDIKFNNTYAAVVKDLNAMTYNPPQLIKLSLTHSAYFNSGVMLLNLKKLREDNISDKLLDYRKKGINYFMDQDAFNVIFCENVIYLPIIYNLITSVIEDFDIKAVNSYYGLTAYDKKEIINNSFIIHYASPYKPWEYNGVFCTEIWEQYYYLSFKEELYRKNFLKTKKSLKNFQKNKQLWNIKLPIIVSLTTIKKRIAIVHNVIIAILNQTVKVDKIILYLGEHDYPNKEMDLPKKLLNLIGDKFEICWREDIGPHTKYFYALKEYNESIVITVDDDINYPINLVEDLLNSYIKYPYAISARRVHLIKFDKKGKILPYRQWKGSYSGIDEVSLALFATGVGGVLYPPNCMHIELFNVEAIKRLCFKADDLWLKIMQVMNNTPVVLAIPKCELNFIRNTQADGLCNTNVSEGGNDIQLKNILNEYNNYFGDYDSLINRIRFSSINYDKVFSVKNINNNNLLYIQIQKELNDLKNSKTYKIGKIIVWLPKKIRGGIHCYKEHGLKYTLCRIKQKTVNLFK